MRKLKKASGEIISVNEILEKKPMKVKNFGLWIRYDSRSGTHNMYKEYRAMSRVEAVEQMYSDLAARHRARFRSVHILKVVELEKNADVKRPYIKQLLDPKLRFPLPSRLPKQAVCIDRSGRTHKTNDSRAPARRSSPPQGLPLGTDLSNHGVVWLVSGPSIDVMILASTLTSFATRISHCIHWSFVFYLSGQICLYSTSCRPVLVPLPCFFNQ